MFFRIVIDDIEDMNSPSNTIVFGTKANSNLAYDLHPERPKCLDEASFVKFTYACVCYTHQQTGYAPQHHNEQDIILMQVISRVHINEIKVRGNVHGPPMGDVRGAGRTAVATIRRIRSVDKGSLQIDCDVAPSSHRRGKLQ